MNAPPPSSEIDLAAAHSVMDDYLASLKTRSYTTRRLNHRTVAQFLDELAEPQCPPSQKLVVDEVRLLRWMLNDLQSRTTSDGTIRLMAARHFLQRLIKGGLLATDLFVELKTALKSHSWRDMVLTIQTKDTASAAIHAKQQYHIDIEIARRAMADLLQEVQPKSRTNWHTHRRTIEAMLAELTEPRDVPRRLILDEPRLLNWMIADCATRTLRTARARFAVISRYLRALVEAGLLRDDLTSRFKARHQSLGWERLIPALQSADPHSALRSLETMPKLSGPLTKHLQSYVSLHQSLGKQFSRPARTLKDLDQFLQHQGIDSLDNLNPAWIEQWLGGMRCAPSTRRQKAGVARQFFDHLHSLGIAAANPVPIVMSRPAPRSMFKPFIYSHEQIQAILDEARKIPETNYCSLKPYVCHAMIVLLYALGLRHREVRRLRIRDLDMDREMLFIERTKFHKSRYIPFGPKVSACLQGFLDLRRTVVKPLRADDPLFVTLWRAPVGHHFLLDAFHRILDTRGIVNQHSPRRPRLHDLRHTFAVHRLLRWYREGVDVQSRLALLSTFMGHVEPRATEVYLTITDELLAEAGSRFYQHFGCAVEQEVSR